MLVGGADAQGETTIQSLKTGALITAPLKDPANDPETRGPVSPGPLVCSESIKTLFGPKPNLTLASRSLLLGRWNHPGAFRSRWALPATGGLLRCATALLSAVCCWATGQRLPGLARPGSVTLYLAYREPGLRVGSARVSTAVGTRTRQAYPWSAPAAWGWESAHSAANARRTKVKGPGWEREGVMAGHRAHEEKCDSFPKGS